MCEYQMYSDNYANMWTCNEMHVNESGTAYIYIVLKWTYKCSMSCAAMIVHYACCSYELM